jgi:hypothetical protein
MLIDECGNQWECTLLFGRRPCLHFDIGGGFNRMVMARRLCEGGHVMVGAPVLGSNAKLFLRVISR